MLDMLAFTQEVSGAGPAKWASRLTRVRHESEAVLEP